MRHTGNLPPMKADFSLPYAEREVSAGHSRAMLCLQLSKTPAQGHRLLTAGADGYAKLWVSNWVDRKLQAVNEHLSAPLLSSRTFARVKIPP